MLTGHRSDRITAALAYEHRAMVSSEGGQTLAGGVLPSESVAPFRIAQLDWSLAPSGDTFSYRHELDRAFVALHPSWGEVTIGRQAIGLHELERKQIPTRRMAGSARRNVFSDLSTPPRDLIDKGVTGSYWEPIGRDPFLEARLIQQITERVQANK